PPRPPPSFPTRRSSDLVFIGPHVCFTNDLYPRAVSPNWRRMETEVEDGVSLGANATIVCGVTIGRNAMIAAGAVVTKDVPPHGLDRKSTRLNSSHVAIS